MEDVAGLRLVDPETTMTRYEQDELCRRIKNTLGPERLWIAIRRPRRVVPRDLSTSKKEERMAKLGKTLAGR